MFYTFFFGENALIPYLKRSKILEDLKEQIRRLNRLTPHGIPKIQRISSKLIHDIFSIFLYINYHLVVQINSCSINGTIRTSVLYSVVILLFAWCSSKKRMIGNRNVLPTFRNMISSNAKKCD